VSGEDDHGAHLSRGEADLGQGRLGLPGEVGQAAEFVGDICLPAKHAAVGNDWVFPCLGVDDEEATGADNNHVDLGAAAAGPLPVGQEVVPGRGQGSEDVSDALLAVGRREIVGGFGPRSLSFEGVGVGEC
jgi:hypothetical protein